MEEETERLVVEEERRQEKGMNGRWERVVVETEKRFRRRECANVSDEVKEVLVALRRTTFTPL